MSLNIDAKSVLVGGIGAYAAMSLLGGSKKTTAPLNGLGRTAHKSGSAKKKASTGPKKRKATKRK